MDCFGYNSVGGAYPRIDSDKVCRISTDTHTVASLIFHGRLRVHEL